MTITTYNIAHHDQSARAIPPNWFEADWAQKMRLVSDVYAEGASYVGYMRAHAIAERRQRIATFVSSILSPAHHGDVASRIDMRRERHALSPSKSDRVRERMRKWDDQIAAIIATYWGTPGGKLRTARIVAHSFGWLTIRNLFWRLSAKEQAKAAARIAARQISAKSYRRQILYSALAILAASRSSFDRYFSSLSWTQRARRLVTRGGALLSATLEPKGDLARIRLEEVAAA